MEEQRLRELQRIADGLGVVDAVEEVRNLLARMAEGRFFLACLGQFKRGKSSVLNGLLGSPLLPVGVVPVTTVVTVIRYAETTSARVRIGGAEWRTIDVAKLAEFVSEVENPDNVKDVRAVEVFVPAPLLRSGMCLVDTPGIGSVFAANTETTKEFVPQIDAALVVIGADPPLSGAELDLVREVASGVHEIIFVLNKADKLTDDEIQQGKAFAAKVLREALRREPIVILVVSALERLNAGAGTREWPALEDHLQRLADNGRAGLVRDAGRRGAQRVVARLLREVRERRGALERPRAESTQRIERLRVAVEEAERTLGEMGYLFTAVQDQLAARFEEDRQMFMAIHLNAATKELHDEIDAARKQTTSGLADRAMDLARQIAREHVEGWRTMIAPVAESLFRESGERFVTIATDFLRRVADPADPSLASLPESFHPDTGFRTKPRFYFHEMVTLGGPGAGGRIVSLVRSREARVSAIKAEATGYLLRLFETNSNRTANDFADQVLVSRRRLQAELRDHLQGVVRAAQESLARAEQTFDAGHEAVSAAIEELSMVEQELQDLHGARAAV